MNTAKITKKILKMQLQIDILKAKQKYLGKLAALRLIENKVWLKNNT